MKKTLVSALTTALVVGVASTTFAAANPFSDVPADHWAYDAVAQLAADGVIEGYGDSSFQGSKNITRYEMAQMVAKAMAKAPQGSSDKALIDRLAAEFADELNNLGVRVANLERNADKVKFTGMVRYDYWTKRDEGEARNTTQNAKFRLYPDAEINDHWHVQARLQGKWDPKADSTTDMNLSYVYAEGKYDNFGINLGKMPLYSTADEGLLIDAMFSGAEVTFGNKLKVTLDAGRANLADFGYEKTGANVDYAESQLDPTGHAKGDAHGDKVANYQAIQLVYGADKLTLGAGYHHFASKDFAYFTGYGADKDDANIWTIGGSYSFDKNVTLAGYYAENTEAGDYEKAGSVQLAYKGAKASNPGSWGAYVAYRYLGQNVSMAPTYDDMWEGMKGTAVGATYTLFKNVTAYGSYTWGKDLVSEKDSNIVFGRLKFAF